MSTALSFRLAYDNVRAHLGRMALSVYLGETAIGLLIFFGFGIGLMGRVGNSVTIPLGLAVFAVQVWACSVWLARFRFGPVEWLWRSLTWLRPAPFRGPADGGAPSAAPSQY